MRYNTYFNCYTVCLFPLQNMYSQNLKYYAKSENRTKNANCGIKTDFKSSLLKIFYTVPLTIKTINFQNAKYPKQ